MKRFAFYFLLLSFLASCSSKHEAGQYSNEVEVKPSSNEIIKLSEFVEDVKFVELEFTNQSIIERISAVFNYDGKYIVADKGTHTIFIFSEEGKFLSKFNRQGRANNEYSSLGAAMFDEQSGRIIVYDFERSNLLYYTLSGECVATHNIGEKCEQQFHAIINLPNGNFLCYAFLHGTLQSPYDGIWEMSPDGETVQWLHRNELVHPCPSPAYALSYNPQGRISISYMEEDSDMEYGDGLEYATKYNVQGATAKDFAGMTNSDYAPNWMQGKMFNARQWSMKIGKYFFSKWSSEESGKPYYTLCDSKTAKVVCGRDIDYSSHSGARALPSVVIKGRDAIEITPSNLRNSVVVPLYAETMISEKYLSQTEALLAGRDVDDMNPILQIWTVRK